MNQLLGCFGIIIVIGLIVMILQWITENIVSFLGLAVAIWGIYEWNKNRKLGAKSKVPGIIVTVGLLFFVGGLIGTSTEETSTDVVQEGAQETVDNEADITVNEEKNKSSVTDQKSLGQTTVEQSSSAEKLGLVIATVKQVVDGDTFELSDGNKVRLIGVNTPESTTRTEEYGKEASNYTKSKLEGKQVYLQKDVSDTDRYGRLLRLVWLEVPTDLMDENEIRSKMFNAELVLNGYAEPSTYPPDVTYADYFRKFAREAREKGIGLWAFGQEGTTKGDLDTEASENNANTASNTQTSANSSKSTTNTTPVQKEYFKNCTELRKVYPNGVPSDHPAYASKHDRDKDGWACER